MVRSSTAAGALRLQQPVRRSQTITLNSTIADRGLKIKNPPGKGGL
jgi:hypothetical protein